jgi:plastocyanin
MKKNYTFLLLMTFFFSSYSFSQLIISELADPNDNAGARFVEIYNVSGSAVDLTDWELRRWTNGNAGPQGTGVDLTPVSSLAANSFIIVAANAAEFEAVYGFAPDIEAGTGGAADSNGDDQIAIFDPADNTIDIFGVPGEDGSLTCHEFEDGRAERIASVTASNPIWDESEWNVWSDSEITGCTSHTLQPINVGDNIYDPGSWIGASAGTDPTVSVSATELTNFVQFVGTPSDEQTTEASGSNLTADVNVSVSGDYEISLTTTTGFATSLILTQNAGELAPTMIYVRLNGSAPASPSNGEITFDFGTDVTLVSLNGEILNPDPVLFTQQDTLVGFSHFVGIPSAEQSVNISGNYLLDDVTIDVTGEFEIALESNGTFGNSLSIPTYANATVFDANAAWNGYMNVFELPENGGGYVFGSGWGLQDLRAFVTPGSNSVKLLPNTNTYADNAADAFWVDQATGAGNKNMEANTFVEPGPSANDNDLTFAGNVVNNNLDAGYTAKYFIKALDPDNGFADAFNGSKTFDLPISGTFSVSATAAELPAGLIIQYGFVMVGPNADPATAAALGSVTINGDFAVGEISPTQVYVRLNGTAQNNNQTGTLTVSSGSDAGAHIVNAGNFYYAPAQLTITAGDTVYWVNDGGTHNVNFTTNTITGQPYNNPESFVSSPTGDTELYSYVFNTPGTYEYDCSVGSHAANGMIGTITVLDNPSPEAGVVALFGETLDYSPYTIGEVTTNTANGVADSLDVLVSLVGVVHCIDFDGNEGISFTIIDDNNDGINVFNFDDVSDYVVNEGDKITVLGKIGQFNGLTQVFADSILVLETGLATVTPTIVTALDESTEAQWITIENVNFVDPIATFPTGSNNIDVTDGTNVFTLRIDSDTDIPGGAAPQVDFSVTGVGGQYDTSDPYDSGYQLFPCGLGSFTPNDVSGFSGAELLAVSVIPNPFNDFIEIKSNGLSNVQVQIHDVQGRLVQSAVVDNGMLINTSHWLKGIYMITLTDGNQNIRTERMIK